MKSSMPRLVFRLGVLVIGLAAASVTSAAQGNPPPAAQATAASRDRLLGVFDIQSGLPLEGVEVGDVLNGTKSLTSKTGTVSLFFLPDGSTLVRVRKLGYQAQTFMVTTSPKDTMPITVVLERLTELPAVVTTDSGPHYINANLRGFEERRHQAFGYFITGAQLREEENSKLFDILSRHIPGLRLQRVPGGIQALVSGRQCYVPIYVDGMPMDPGTSHFDMRDLETVSNFGAIEYYAGPATIPPQFNITGKGCGALLIWTRER